MLHVTAWLPSLGSWTGGERSCGFAAGSEVLVSGGLQAGVMVTRGVEMDSWVVDDMRCWSQALHVAICTIKRKHSAHAASTRRYPCFWL